MKSLTTPEYYNIMTEHVAVDNNVYISTLLNLHVGLQPKNTGLNLGHLKMNLVIWYVIVTKNEMHNLIKKLLY